MHEHKYSSAYVDGGLLCRDLHSGCFFRSLMEGEKWGEHDIRTAFGTSTAQFVSLSYSCFLSFSFSFSSFVSSSLEASCRTEGLASYEMVLAAYTASFSFSLFHPEFPPQSSAAKSSRNHLSYAR